jgi:hypothetical protein
MSPTYLVFNSSAVKSRPIRSATFAASGSGTVVRCRRRRRSPANPTVFMTRATRLCFTTSPFSRNSAVILGTP